LKNELESARISLNKFKMENTLSIKENTEKNLKIIEENRLLEHMKKLDNA
jgi:hypothetical protein